MKLSEKAVRILTFVAIIIGALLELNGKNQDTEEQNIEPPKSNGEL